MARISLTLCLAVLTGSSVFADAHPPKVSPGCKGGTIPAHFMVRRVVAQHTAAAMESLRTMKGVILAESVPDTTLVRVLATDMAITSERVVQCLHLAGYEATEASKNEFNSARDAIQDEPERIIIARSAGSDPGTRIGTQFAAEAEIVFPDTTAGRIAREYMEAFNSGDPDIMRAMELKHRSASALKSRSMDERIHQYQELYAGWGRLQVRGLEYEGDRDITVEVVTAKSEMGLRAIFELEESTEKLNLVRLTPSMLEAELPDATPDPTVQVTSIADSIEPLKKRFNEHRGKPRFVAILSPT